MRTINRKGIYQTFDPSGSVIADERWQAITLADGSIQVDNETVRVAPFDEPRSDSMTISLDPRLRLIELTIHGLFGTRESRICVLGEQRDRATICWRHKAEIHEKHIVWHEDLEIDWLTPLCRMVTIWRSRLQPGQSRTCETYRLDPVSFKPTAQRLTYVRLADEPHPTRFGDMVLHHYRVESDDPLRRELRRESEFWCDDDGVIYDFVAADGVRFELTAVNAMNA